MADVNVLNNLSRAYNGGFEIADGAGVFPDGWSRGGGDASSAYIWSTENVYDGVRSLKIVNPTFTGNLVSVIQTLDAATPVSEGERWEASAWMLTDAAGKELRLLVDFYGAGGAFVHSAHLKFTSTTSLRHYQGVVTVPAGAALAALNVGMHDTGTVWIDGVRFVRVQPATTQSSENQNVIHSREGRYYVGTTPAITTIVGDDVVVQLVNPSGSGRNVHVVAHTLGIEVGGTFFFYFDATPSVAVSTSPNVAVVNRSFVDDHNVARIAYARAASITLSGGRLAFTRIVPTGGATIEADQEGKFILRPGSNFTLLAQDLKAGQLFVAFGWWEEDAV